MATCQYCGLMIEHNFSGEWCRCDDQQPPMPHPEWPHEWCSDDRAGSDGAHNDLEPNAPANQENTNVR